MTGEEATPPDNLTRDDLDWYWYQMRQAGVAAAAEGESGQP
jgi:hypothetical protein